MFLNVWIINFDKIILSVEYLRGNVCFSLGFRDNIHYDISYLNKLDNKLNRTNYLPIMLSYFSSQNCTVEIESILMKAIFRMAGLHNFELL